MGNALMEMWYFLSQEGNKPTKTTVATTFGIQAAMEDTKIRHIPLFVEIKSEACKDEGKERHEDSYSDRTAVGRAIRFGVNECNILPHTQTWKKNIIFGKKLSSHWMKNIKNIEISKMALEQIN